MENPSDLAKQELEWAQLYARLEKILPQFGKSDYIGRGDYWVVDDNWGCRQHKLIITNLKMISPNIVKQLQKSLANFPNWEIVIAIDLEGPGKLWPEMGLIVRHHEIIDDLQRQYFPKEFRNLTYHGSRRGRVFNEN
jgi:hypothetical protein